jgi:hypothetical protein
VKELTIKIFYDDQGGYQGHGEAKEVIINSIKTAMDFDLEQEEVIKPGWRLEIIN